MKKSKTFTYRVRVEVSLEADKALSAFAGLFSQMERSLFCDMQKGKDLNELKRKYLSQFEVTARQFNSCKIALQGKIESLKQLKIQNIENLKETIKALFRKIPKIKSAFVKHQKKRKLQTLTDRLKTLEEKKESLCFGTKKLFHAQFFLKENGYFSHKKWKKDWKKARNSEFFLVGSKDETGGNQSCVLFRMEEKLCLRLRLPHKLTEKYGKHLVLDINSLSYGRKELEKALLLKTALTYRFKKKEEGWTVFISFSQEEPVALTTRKELGSIGLDLNVDHIALVEIDSKGNPIQKKRIPLVTYGKTTHQSKALIGEASKTIVAFAKKTGKPLVLEDLDFTEKKLSLKKDSPKRARMLSSFHYKELRSLIEAKAFKEGVEVFFVNPAYTSIIGRVKFSKKYGLTVHQGAALCIARRLFQFSEKPSRCIAKVVHKNVQVTFPLPERNRRKHVWAFWGQVNRKLKVALAAHIRGSPDSRMRQSG